MIDQSLNLFNLGLRTEFLQRQQVVADPAPYQEFTQVVDSKQRIENYAWMSPPPRLSEYMGRRRAAMMSTIKYSVLNKEYDKTVEIPLRDANDDLLGGWKIQMGKMADDTKDPFKSKLVLSLLAKGGTETCFDGSTFFATSHTIGSAPSTAPSASFGGSGNALTFSAAANADGTTHKVIALVKTGSSGVKPLIYQNRQAPQLMTDFGTPEMFKNKKISYWCDLEAASAFGYWWDACQVTITGTPTLAEMQTIIDGIQTQMYQFKLPQNVPGEPDEFVHEQMVFSSKTISVACSSTVSRLLQHLFGEERIGFSSIGTFTNNIYYNWASLCPTSLLNTGAVLL